VIAAIGIMAGFSTVLFLLAFLRKDGSHKRGVSRASRMLLQMLPVLTVAFVMAGMLQVAVPPHLIQRLMGADAGMSGILLASVAGGVCAFGPYVFFPLVGSLYAAGAGLGAVVAMVTGWALWGVGRLPYELALAGPWLTLVRYAVAAVFPPLAGFLAEWIF